MINSWHLLTGEYPPLPGGISDYSALVAAGLADAGFDVHVWTINQSRSARRNLSIHNVGARWSASNLESVDSALAQFPAPRRLLVQYAPNNWGYRGLNFAFCHWLLNRRAQGDDIRLMVHEPFYPWRLWDKPTRWILAAGQRFMMKTLLQASHQVYLSIQAWEDYLAPYQRRDRASFQWLPVFSNIPVTRDDEQVATLRRIYQEQAQTVVGTFSTFGSPIGKAVLACFQHLLRRTKNVAVLLIGRGAQRAAERIRNAENARRIFVVEDGSPEKVSINLQACDILVQPYPDGISSRRTTAMAGLAHGIALVTNQGKLSEPLWAQSEAVLLTASDDPRALVNGIERCLDDEVLRRRIGEAGRRLYHDQFTVTVTIQKLLATPSITNFSTSAARDLKSDLYPQ